MKSLDRFKIEAAPDIWEQSNEASSIKQQAVLLKKIGQLKDENHKLREKIIQGDFSMTTYEYQQAVERTTVLPPDEKEYRFTNFGMGLAGEAGEVVDQLKKTCFHGHELDVKHLSEELGDVMWYVATIANTAGISLDAVMCENVQKLKERYPEGFDKERSKNRTR